jgi:hypothetical protein
MVACQHCSESLELNDLAEHANNSVLKGRAVNADNVAAMVLLQPWQVLLVLIDLA